MLVRVVLFACLFAASGLAPAFAWAQAQDPCADGGTHAVHDAHEDENCADDCRAACQCPCCPMRVSVEPPELAPPLRKPAPSILGFAPTSRLRAGVKSEIFHPPSA